MGLVIIALYSSSEEVSLDDDRDTYEQKDPVPKIMNVLSVKIKWFYLKFLVFFQTADRFSLTFIYQLYLFSGNVKIFV